MRHTLWTATTELWQSGRGTVSGASWTNMAEQDLVEVGDTAIIHRLMKIADETLRLPPRDHSPDEGWVAGREGSLAWRRGTPLSQNADDSDGAADYYIIYGEPTDEEYRMAGRHVAFTVMRVLHVMDFESLGT